jgi:hypothetical protein
MPSVELLVLYRTDSSSVPVDRSHLRMELRFGLGDHGMKLEFPRLQA